MHRCTDRAICHGPWARELFGSVMKDTHRTGRLIHMSTPLPTWQAVELGFRNGTATWPRRLVTVAKSLHDVACEQYENIVFYLYLAFILVLVHPSTSLCEYSFLPFIFYFLLSTFYSLLSTLHHPRHRHRHRPLRSLPIHPRPHLSSR